MTTSAAPLVSVVLYAREASPALGVTLSALAACGLDQTLELILADATTDGGLEALCATWPGARRVARPRANLVALRGEAFAAARADIVAFVGATVVVGPDWGRELLRAFAEEPRTAAIGGPVRCAGSRRAANRAAYLFEYGAFHPPLAEGPTAGDLPGINVAYRRRVVGELCADLMTRRGFDKPFVHARLRAHGWRLVLRSGLEAEHRSDHRLAPLVRKRFHFGRCFGGNRIGEALPRERRRLRALAPAVPAYLVARHVRRALAHPQQRSWLPTCALPLAAVCLAWGLGEWLGLWAGPGASCAEVS